MNDDRQETLRKIDAWVARFLSKGHLFGKRRQVETEPSLPLGTSVRALDSSKSNRATDALRVTGVPAEP